MTSVDTFLFLLLLFLYSCPDIAWEEGRGRREVKKICHRSRAGEKQGWKENHAESLASSLHVKITKVDKKCCQVFWQCQAILQTIWQRWKTGQAIWQRWWLHHTACPPLRYYSRGWTTSRTTGRAARSRSSPGREKKIPHTKKVRFLCNSFLLLFVFVMRKNSWASFWLLLPRIKAGTFFECRFWHVAEKVKGKKTM